MKLIHTEITGIFKMPASYNLLLLRDIYSPRLSKLSYDSTLYFNTTLRLVLCCLSGLEESNLKYFHFIISYYFILI